MIDKEELLDRPILSIDNIMYHGTSIECLNQIIECGYLDSGSHFAFVKNRLDKLFSRDGRAKLKKEVHEPHYVTYHESYNYSRFIARTKAFYDSLCSGAGLGDLLDNCEHHDNMFMEGKLCGIDRREIIKIGEKLGYTHAQMQDILKTALKRRGAIIGIGTEFFSGKEFEDFEFNEFYLVYPREHENNDVVGVQYIHSIIIPRAEERKEFLS